MVQFVHSTNKKTSSEEKKIADGIQLWCRITKTEYSNPPDTGNLSSGGQLSDGNL